MTKDKKYKTAARLLLVYIVLVTIGFVFLTVKTVKDNRAEDKAIENLCDLEVVECDESITN